MDLKNYHIHCNRCSRSFWSAKPPACGDLVCKFYDPKAGKDRPVRHPIEIIEESELAKHGKKHKASNDTSRNNEVLLDDRKKMTYPQGAVVDVFHPDDTGHEVYQPGEQWQGDHWGC